MDKQYSNYLNLVRAALHKTPVELESPVDWDVVYSLLETGKLLSCAYSTVDKLPEDLKPDAERMEQWRKDTFSKGMYQLTGTQQLCRVLKAAEEADLHPVIFKGYPLAQLYPEPNTRYSSDVDLYIDAEYRPGMEELLKSLGFEYLIKNSKQHVPVYRYRNGLVYLKIELHDCLWEDYEGTQTRLLDSLHLTAPENRLAFDIAGIPATTLDYLPHLIFQVFHVAKHFAVEGLPMRYLTDLMLFIDKYEQEIDWKQFWDTMRLLKYEVFIASVLKICEDYLGMKSRVREGKLAKIEVNEDILIDIIRGGEYDDEAQIESFAATELIASYLMRDHQRGSSQTKNNGSIFFPKPSELKVKFSYAKKHPILLPIAWIHRYCSAIRYYFLCKTKGYSALDVLSSAQHRLDLMAELDLIEQ